MPTGIALGLPPGVAALTLPRSGLAARHGITIVNAPGLIDPGYRGEIQIILLNTDRSAEFVVHAGDRIAQLLLVDLLDAAPGRGRRARRHGARRARLRLERRAPGDAPGAPEARVAVAETRHTSGAHGPARAAHGDAGPMRPAARAADAANGPTTTPQRPAGPTVRAGALIITDDGLLLVRQRRLGRRATGCCPAAACGSASRSPTRCAASCAKSSCLEIEPGRPLAVAEAISDDMARYPKHVVHVIVRGHAGRRCGARAPGRRRRRARGALLRRARRVRGLDVQAADRAVSRRLLRRATAAMQYLGVVW